MAEKVALKTPLLSLGMPRTGTASLMKALEILGYPNCHHGWDISEDKSKWYQWELFDRANHATFPDLYPAEPLDKSWTRDDWEQILGGYDAASDLAAYNAESLLRAYPDAKVILVERDIDRWEASIRPIVEPYTQRSHRFVLRVVGRLSGLRAGVVCLEMAQGWSRSEHPNDIFKNLKPAYIRHYKYVRETVPKEQLLDFQLSEGWGPLCEFLGKDIPTVPFPHINDAVEYKARSKRVQKLVLKLAAKNFFFPWLRKSLSTPPKA